MKRFAVIFLSTLAFIICYIAIWYLTLWIFPNFKGALKAAVCAGITVILTPKVSHISSQSGRQTVISWLLLGKSWVV
ncbi:hypothetical protein [Leeuwenhoekiella marinoflava]|uniref:Uncharacterized protein n=2 Tax=Leeuwenhoekiella marinoflava TaxID=988 RepID=A0A4Q0PLN1_9FLAO|nr:hypothetical protein [Leeuwenhoekiella marinoflava]RXG29968.1 hypothetical protein DSL99_2024 [Leeuwenhoekiella marinoflava]SHF24892.1 hypothetical protein SAMN02745246_02013 [Leeuwenhoekiella marinoflava DSM 3653]